MTAPRVAPIIGITSSSATTTASATAYSPEADDEQEDQRRDAGAQGHHERAGDVAADALEDPVAEALDPARGLAGARR